MSRQNALQKLIYQRLQADAAVAALVAGRIHDRPAATVAAPYVSFGPSDSVPDDYECIDGEMLTLQLDVWSEAQDGKRECKAIVDAVRTALHDTDGELEVGALLTMRVVLTRVFDDPDGRTTHGVLQVECLIEDGV